MADDESTENTEISGEETAPANSWKAPSSQEELDKIIAARVARVQKRYADYDSLKEKAARADALDNELASETEKAVRAAREEERKQVQAQTTPRLVRAEFRAAAKGVLSNEQLNGLLEDVDLNRFITDTGDVDEERIAKKISALAPPVEDKPRFPDLGGGKRGSNSTATNMSQLIRQAAGLG
jgi:hypothetical protein